MIDLPNQRHEKTFQSLLSRLDVLGLENSQQEPKKFSEKFFEDVESVFKKVYSQREMFKMKEFDPRAQTQKSI